MQGSTDLVLIPSFLGSKETKQQKLSVHLKWIPEGEFLSMDEILHFLMLLLLMMICERNVRHNFVQVCI